AVDGAGNIYVADSGNHTVRKITPTGVVTTLAGLPGVPGSSDGVGTTARFYSPSAVAVDGTGNVFVPDMGNFTIRKITSAGTVTTFAGAAGQSGNVDGTGASARFGFTSGKTGLVVDSGGNLYVADGNIRKITPAGVVTTFIKQGAPVSFPYAQLTLNYSLSLGIDAADNLYSNENVQGDWGAVKISPAGAAEVVLQGGESGAFVGLTADSAGHVYTVDSRQTLFKDNTPLAGYPTAYYGLPTHSVDGPAGSLGFPSGPSVDNSSGNVYFSDHNTNSIRFVAPNGSVATLAGETDDGVNDGAGSVARFNRPSGLAVDGAGNVYVADYGSSTIRKVAPDGAVTTLAGAAFQTGSADGQGTSARFKNPQGVAIDSVGNVYVADTANQIVRKISPVGDVTTLAGLAGQSGYVDGTGTAARFTAPAGVAVDTSGNVYVCDSGNQTIRRITSTGIVSTYAGVPGPGNQTRVDGPAASAKFTAPETVAVDGAGNLWITEGTISSTGALRKITASGVVSTVSLDGYTLSYPINPAATVDGAGNVFLILHDAVVKIDSSGAVNPLHSPEGAIAPSFVSSDSGPYNTSLTVDSAGNIYFSDPSYTIRKLTPLATTSASLAFTSQPSGGTINAGDSLILSGSATGNQPIAYQWRKDGRDIPGATSSTLSLTGAVAANSGIYYLFASNSTGVLVSNPASLVVKVIPMVSATISTYRQSANTILTSFAGDRISLEANATASPDPTFQWFKNGVAFNGGTISTTPGSDPNSHRFANTCVLDNVSTADSGSYTVMVSNSAGSVTSETLLLTITPTVTRGPADQAVPSGNDASFSAVATGSSNLTYQWTKDGVAIPGATSSSLLIKSAQPGDAGNYAVVVSDPSVPNSTITSNAASLKVTGSSVAPTIFSQPVDLLTYVNQPSPAIFQVQASGSPSIFSFQWKKDGVDIPGATSDTLSFTSVTPAEVGTYSVTVTNAVGTVKSREAALILLEGAGLPAYPTIVTPPADQSVSSGSSVSFSVVATGTPPVTYQWQKNGTTISGATTDTLSLISVTAADAGTYTVIVTLPPGTVPLAKDFAGMTARSATLTVNGSTAAQPLPKTVTAGHAVTFSAGAAIGSIQWQVSANNGSTWTNLADDTMYSGAATAILTVSNAGSTLNGTQYRYVVTNSGATTTSSAATLSVAQAFFPFPTAIAADSAGNLFVADANTDTIQKINAAGQVSLIAGASGTAGSTDGSGTAARFNQPAGLIVLSTGVLIVGDTANATIRSIAASGVVTTLAGNAGTRGSANGTGNATTFSTPIGIAADPGANIYVADAMNDIIRKISATGTVTTLAGTAGVTGSTDANSPAARFNYPTGIAVDSSGSVYLSDTTNNLIRKITPTGSVSTLAGLAGVSGSADGTGSEALFNHPGGLALDSSGNLYLADTANSTIRKINSAGTVSTLAGLPGIAGLQDGVGPSAFFNQPQALALDPNGNILVADTGNATIRKVTPAGVVSTLSLAAAPISDGNSGGGGTSGGSSGGGGTTPPPGSSGNSSNGGGGGSVGMVFGIALAVLAMGRLGSAGTQQGVAPRARTSVE
ncbi:MAG TPA: immunoglobulin domain-containing protein, partial [Lacunisphaera sp.]